MTTTDRHSRETREAARWWARLGTRSSREISQAERAEYARWLRESPLHIAEILHVARVHDALERFKHWEQIQPGPISESENIVELEAAVDHVAKAKDTTWEITRDWRRRNRLAAFGAAAATAVVLVAVVLSGVLAPTIATERAERREVVLSDGSIVQLDPETLLRVRLSSNERRVTLSRGRALFEVAKDPNRPFLVVANDSVIRAVGTVFGVEHQHGSVVVTVSEGKVAVLSAPAAPSKAANNSVQSSVSSKPAQAASDTGAGVTAAARERNDVARADRGQSLERFVYLAAGEQLMIDGSEITAPHVVDTERALAWVEGRLVFESTPLGEVIEQFNRYNQIQLRLNGAELARRPISGVFEASDVETLIAFVRAGASVNVSRKSSGEILISAAP